MPIYNRNGIWHIQFDIRGRRFKRTAGRGSSRQEAKELERELRKQIQKQLDDESFGRIPDKTFGEALVRWLDEDAPKSMYCHIRIVAPVLKDIKLKNIIQAVAGFKQKMITANLKPATINRRLSVVRRVLNKCYQEWEWLPQPLGEKIKMLPEKNQRHFYLSPEQVDELASFIDFEDEVAGYMVRLAAYTGLRKGEIEKLQPSNFIEGRIVLDEKTKSGRPRVVPVPDHIHYIMKKLPIVINERNFYRIFDIARKKLGMPDLHFHDLRHTYGSWLASNPNIPPSVIRDLMGHSNLSVSSRYLHLATRSLDEAVARLPKPKK